MPVREPLLHTVPIADLRPPQVTVRYRELLAKRPERAERAGRDRGEWLGRHMIPVPLGPKKRSYVIDSLARAPPEEGCERALVNVVADLSMLDKEGFRVFAEHCRWCHPYDLDCRHAGYDAIPKAIADLADDPYRSLAGALRRAGGFAEDTGALLRGHVGRGPTAADRAA